MDMPMILAAVGIGIAILLAAFLSIYQQARARSKQQETVRAVRAANLDAKDSPPGATPFFIASFHGNDARFFRVYRAPDELLFVNAGAYFAMIDAEAPRGSDRRHWMLRSVRAVVAALGFGSVATLIALAAVALGIARNPVANPTSGATILLGVLGLAALLAFGVTILVPVALWNIARRVAELDALSLGELRELVATDPKSFRAAPDNVSELAISRIGDDRDVGPTDETRIAISFKHAPTGRWKIETLTTPDSSDAVRACLAVWGRERAKVEHALLYRLAQLGSPDLAPFASDAGHSPKPIAKTADQPTLPLPRPPQAEAPVDRSKARRERAPLGTYSVNGCGTMVCEARGIVRWESNIEDSDGVIAFCLLGIPLIPYRAVHASNWQSVDSPGGWEYECHPIRWSWDLVAAAFLRGTWVWLLVFGLIGVAIAAIALSSPAAMANQPAWVREGYGLPLLGLGGATLAALAVGLRVALGTLDRRHVEIRRLIGRHPLGSSDPAYWTPAILSTVLPATESFGAPTFAAAVPALVAEGEFSRAMFAARLCTALEDRAVGERLTDSLLANPEARLAKERTLEALRRRRFCMDDDAIPVAERSPELFR